VPVDVVRPARLERVPPHRTTPAKAAEVLRRTRLAHRFRVIGSLDDCDRLNIAQYPGSASVSTPKRLSAGLRSPNTPMRASEI